MPYTNSNDCRNVGTEELMTKRGFGWSLSLGCATACQFEGVAAEPSYSGARWAGADEHIQSRSSWRERMRSEAQLDGNTESSSPSVGKKPVCPS